MRQYYSTIFSLHNDIKSNDKSLALFYKLVFVHLKNLQILT